MQAAPPPLRQFFRQKIAADGIRLTPNIYHDYVCDQIEHVIYRHPGYENIQFVVINIPPRFGKTKILEAANLHQLACFQNSQLLFISNSSDNATKSVKEIRDTMERPWWAELYPDTRGGDISKADHFNTDRGGELFAYGLEGQIIGKGAGLKTPCGGFISADDLNKPNSTGSEAATEQVNNAFMFLLTRRNGGGSTPIIVVQQRIGFTDVTEYILKTFGKPKRKGYNSLPDPADIVLHIKIPALQVINGEEQSIMPDAWSTADLQLLRAVRPEQFYSMYQQSPVIQGGNVIQVNRFVMQGLLPDETFERKILTSDTAAKTREHNDWSVIQCWGLRRRKAYLLDQVRGKWESPELISQSVSMWNRHNLEGSPLSGYYIEDASSGTSLIQHLIKLGIPAMGIVRKHDKVTRVQDMLPFIHVGLVVLNDGQEWVPGFKSECMAFRKDMKHEFDDQIDAMCDALQELLGPVHSSLDAFLEGDEGRLVDYMPGGKFDILRRRPAA